MVSQSKLHKMKGKKDNLGWENLEITLEDKKIFWSRGCLRQIRKMIFFMDGKD